MTGEDKFLEEIAKKDALTVILAMSASFECIEVYQTSVSININV